MLGSYPAKPPEPGEGLQRSPETQEPQRAHTWPSIQAREERGPPLGAGPNSGQTQPSVQATWTTLEPPGIMWTKYAASGFDFNC